MTEAIKSIGNFFISIGDTFFNIGNFIISIIKFIIKGIGTIFNGLSYLGDMLYNTSLFESLSGFLDVSDGVYGFLGYGAGFLFLGLSIILVLALFTFVLRLMRGAISFNKSEKSVKKSFK